MLCARNERRVGSRSVKNYLLWNVTSYCVPRFRKEAVLSSSKGKERKRNVYAISKGIILLNSTGYVMHQQFNIQQLYVLPTLYLCVLYLSENKQRLLPLTA